MIIFPNNYRFNEVLESDLHLLLKYYVSVIPKNDQVSILLTSAIVSYSSCRVLVLVL